MLLRIAVLFLLLLMGFGIMASDIDKYSEPWRIVSFSQNEGLPKGKTYGIFKQKNGTMWVATETGIASFDGYKWNNIAFIQDKILIKERRIIKETNNGSIICLHNDTLYEIKNNKYRKLLYSIDNKILQISNYVLLPNGTEYLLTHNTPNEEVDLVEKAGRKYKIIKHFTNIKDPFSYQIFENNTHSLLFNDGLQIQLLLKDNSLKPIMPKSDWILRITKTQNDKEGNLYFYIESIFPLSGIYTYTKSGNLQKENPFSTNKCLSFDVDNSGNILALSDIGKTYIKCQGEWREWSIFENYYNKTFIQFSDKGDIWVGGQNKLICYNANDPKCKNIFVGETYETNSVNEIFIDKDDNTWLAKNKGLTIIDKNNNRKEYDKILGKKLQNLTTINQDKNGYVWIASGVEENSTYRYDGEKFERIGLKDGLSDKSIHRIWKDNKGDLWFSVFDNQSWDRNGAVGIYKQQNNTIVNVPEINAVTNSKRIYAMLFDNDGSIWLGSSLGLIKYKQGIETKWQSIDGAGLGKVSDIVKDKDGKIWFASAYNGICTVAGDKIISISKKNNTDYPLEYCDLEFDKNNTLWYGGKEFLTAYSNGMYYRIGSGEGLSSQASWPIKYTNNKVMVGTLGGGLSVFDLTEIEKSYPTIEISETQTFAKSLFVKWKAFAKDKVFNNNKISCAWRIDGGEWNVNTNREIAINNLSYGKHLFEIKTFCELPTQHDNNISQLEVYIPYPFYLSKYYIIPISILVILLLIGIYIYLTTQAKLVKNIKQKEEHLGNLGGALPIIPFVINENGIVIESFLNHKNKSIDFNLDVNVPLAKQLPDKYKTTVLQAIKSCFENQLSEVIEITYTKYSEEKTYEFRFSPYTSEFKQQLRTAACVAINITQNKKNEAELIKARIIAESSDKAKMLFLTNMSHEIRTPMNAIVGITDILLNENIELKFKENLNIIKHSADNLLVIINDILDFSKIEAGKIEFERIEFDIRELIENVVKPFLIKTTQKGLYLNTKLDENLPNNLIGDPFRLNQILVNIINNAIKFTQQGGITFSIDITQQDENNVQIKFIVLDTGIGISKDKIGKIFESFTQESNVITRKYGGTGLGLTISKRLVEMQEGKIHVESEVGVGSQFIVNLPFGISRKSHTFKKDMSNLKDLTNLKILVVEDNSMNQIVAIQILHKWNAIVDTANNGIEAIEILSTKYYDVILMDLQMPVMDGYEATKIIRDENSKVLNHNVPIIALTADAFPEIKRKALSCGMNDFITKPFKQDELFVKLSKHGYQLD